MVCRRGRWFAGEAELHTEENKRQDYKGQHLQLLTSQSRLGGISNHSLATSQVDPLSVISFLPHHPTLPKSVFQPHVIFSLRGVLENTIFSVSLHFYPFKAGYAFDSIHLFLLLHLLSNYKLFMGRKYNLFIFFFGPQLPVLFLIKLLINVIEKYFVVSSL